MNAAYTLLQEAEIIDTYHSSMNLLNKAARSNYAPWHDQTEAIQYERICANHGKEVRCVIMNPSADGGMPHTRGKDIICIPAHWSPSSLEETLRHELVHIDQKRNPAAWRQRLLEEGWQPDVDIPSSLKERCRLNPDTIGSRFAAWEGRWVALPLFVREDKPQLREIQVRWYDREEGRVYTNAPFSFLEKYGRVSQAAMEHPYELWAYQ